MTMSAARKWLALYFFLTTCITGAAILLLGGGTFVPLEESDVSHSFQIVIPVLLGQVAVIFQWIARNDQDWSKDAVCPVPAWAIRVPPISAAVLAFLSVAMLFVSNLPNMKAIRFGPDRFQSMLTFIVSILNASTVILVGRLFPGVAAQPGQTPSTPEASGTREAAAAAAAGALNTGSGAPGKGERV